MAVTVRVHGGMGDMGERGSNTEGTGIGRRYTGVGGGSRVARDVGIRARAWWDGRIRAGYQGQRKKRGV